MAIGSGRSTLASFGSSPTFARKPRFSSAVVVRARAGFKTGQEKSSMTPGTPRHSRIFLGGRSELLTGCVSAADGTALPRAGFSWFHARIFAQGLLAGGPYLVFDQGRANTKSLYVFSSREAPSRPFENECSRHTF